MDEPETLMLQKVLTLVVICYERAYLQVHVDNVCDSTIPHDAV